MSKNKKQNKKHAIIDPDKLDKMIKVVQNACASAECADMLKFEALPLFAKAISSFLDDPRTHKRYQMQNFSRQDLLTAAIITGAFWGLKSSGPEEEKQEKSERTECSFSISTDTTLVDDLKKLDEEQLDLAATLIFDELRNRNNAKQLFASITPRAKNSKKIDVVWTDNFETLTKKNASPKMIVSNALPGN